MENNEHFMICPICGIEFDMRDLGQVFEHMHKESASIDSEIFKRIRARRVGDPVEWFGEKQTNLN
jgi:hypothetical protein